MYSVLGRKTIAIQKIYTGAVIHNYHNVHRYPPISDLFVAFGFTKGPPLLHSLQPNTKMHGRTLVSSSVIDIGEELTYDFSNFQMDRIWNAMHNDQHH